MREYISLEIALLGIIVIENPSIAQYFDSLYPFLFTKTSMRMPGKRFYLYGFNQSRST